MKRLKRREEISAMQSGITAVHQFHFSREHLLAREPAGVFFPVQSIQQLQTQRDSAAQLKHQHGVWV
jgi:hypothetical protein